MSALDIVVFIKSQLSEYCIGGDVVMLSNMKISTLKDVENWMGLVKTTIGPRNYTIVKNKFEDSQVLDLGFRTIDFESEDLNYLESIIEIPFHSVG